MKNSDLFFWFFFALQSAWAWNFKKAQSALAFCLFSHKFKSYSKAFCLVKFRAKCARLALTNAPQKRPLNTNLARFMAKIHSFFKVHFGREFYPVKFGAKRPFITNFSVNFNANFTQIFVNSATFLLNFAYKFTNSHFKAYR